MAAGLALCASGAAAEPLHGRIAIGAGYVPDYDGSNDYEAVPYPEIELDRGNYTLQFTGGAIRANVIDSDTLRAGPLLGFRRARSEVADPQVRRMHHLPASFNAGGFVEYRHQPADPRSGEEVSLSLSQSFAGADGGLTATVRGLLHRPIKMMNRGLIGTIEADATWADDAYMRTYFGVSPADAAASGLPGFRAGGGLRDAGFALALDQFFTRNWSVGVRAHYARFLGDAGASPVTAIAGSRNQLFAGMVVGYRF